MLRYWLATVAWPLIMPFGGIYVAHVAEPGLVQAVALAVYAAVAAWWWVTSRLPRGGTYRVRVGYARQIVDHRGVHWLEVHCTRSLCRQVILIQRHKDVYGFENVVPSIRRPVDYCDEPPMPPGRQPFKPVGKAAIVSVSDVCVTGWSLRGPIVNPRGF